MIYIIFKVSSVIALYKECAKLGLEPVCCKKLQKIVPDQLLFWGVGGPLKNLKFYTIQNLQMALIPQTSNWSETVFGHFLQQS